MVRTDIVCILRAARRLGCRPPPLEHPLSMSSNTLCVHTVLARTRRWLERAVIGLNLCPFAKAVHVKGQIRWVVSTATTPAQLLDDLQRELHHLAQADPQVVDTTLLIHPQVLTDFLDFNDFLGEADALVAELGLEGVLQVASFHPDYQFGDAEAEDIAHATNRSPYPTLHLLREDSIERAVTAFAQPEAIYERNIATLRRLGPEGWARLMNEDTP
jgi:hypothetical protein